jgi:hypothetical protein
MAKVWRCTPCGATINYDTALNIELVTKTLENAGIDVHTGFQSGTFCDHSHNIATARFLESDCDFLWWIDSDMLMPADAGVRLLNCASALAGVVYRRRMYPHDLMGLKANGKPFTRDDEGILDAYQLGTGCLMVHRSVYTGAPHSLRYPWYENLYGDNPGQFEGGDTVFVRKAVVRGHPCKAELYVSRDIKHTGSHPLGWFDYDDKAMRKEAEHKKILAKGNNYALGEPKYPTPEAVTQRLQDEHKARLEKVNYGIN